MNIYIYTYRKNEYYYYEKKMNEQIYETAKEQFEKKKINWKCKSIKKYL